MEAHLRGRVIGGLLVLGQRDLSGERRGYARPMARDLGDLANRKPQLQRGSQQYRAYEQQRHQVCSGGRSVPGTQKP